MNPNTVSSKCKFLQALPVSSEKADLSARLVEMTGMALSRSLHAACGLGRDDRGTLRSVEMTWVSFRAEDTSLSFRAEHEGRSREICTPDLSTRLVEMTWVSFRAEHASLSFRAEHEVRSREICTPDLAGNSHYSREKPRRKHIKTVSILVQTIAR